MSYQNNYIPKHVLGNSNLLPQLRANQSMFNLSEDLKTTIKFDYLYPVMWEEMNPGDRFDVSTKSLARLMPMVAPVMSNIKMKYFAFFVPNRLLWQNWSKFMGEKLYHDDTTDYVVPNMDLTNIESGNLELADYLGVPIDRLSSVDKTIPNISELPFRAYKKIWNEWFRANELQPVIPENSSDSYVTGMGYQLLKKGKPLDYFTSCLPYPQAGEPVMIPLTGNAPVLRQQGVPTVINGGIDGTSDGQALIVHGAGTTNENLKATWPSSLGNETNLYADMSDVTGVSIEMLRKASALQVLLEKDARSGETYIDLVNVHWGTTVPDFLVGRSQFLGSSSTYLNVEPIAQTNGTTSESPQGNLAAVGIGVNGEKLCEISAVEHGIFMILACADAELSYSQGLPRKFSKQSRYDYMFPEFHNLGDQAVLNKEIYVSGNPDLDNQVFGYQERYRELRESTNKVSGLMRHDVSGSLDVWHLGQNFANTPTLSSSFIESNTPIDRVMAVPTEDHIVLNIFFDIKAVRTLPVTSNPSILAGRV